MGNAWFVSPLTADWVEPLQREGVSVPEGTPSIAPTAEQVFSLLEAFPEYHAQVRRRERPGKGQAISIDLRRADNSYAIEISLLGFWADDQPVGVFVFPYYRETEELVRLVQWLADRCGPLVLWHDSGGESTRVICPAANVE